MKIKSSVVIFFSLLALSLPAADSAGRLHFPESGFSIVPLDLSPGPITRTAVVMSLPGGDKLTANVKVTVQAYPDSIEQYTKTILSQFNDRGPRLIAQKKLGKSVVLFEYAGGTPPKLLHIYTRVEKSGGYIYLATATALDSEWTTSGPQLKACVDSFHCDQNNSARTGRGASGPGM